MKGLRVDNASREKILKLLELTASEHDGEVLNAIRKANDIRRKGDWQWMDLFEKPPESALPPVVRNRPQPPPNVVTVEMMFKTVLNRQLSDALHAKIEEMHYIYTLTGQLSGDECSMLINTYNGNCA